MFIFSFLFLKKIGFISISVRSEDLYFQLKIVYCLNLLIIYHAIYVFRDSALYHLARFAFKAGMRVIAT